jgi:hypothetical protein
MNRKGFFKIFHATSWNIPNIFFCHVELIYDMVIFHALSWNILPCHICALLGSHSWCNQCSKYLGLSYNTFNIFKTIEMTRNYMPEKYSLNLN